MRLASVLEADQNDETIADRITNREKFKTLAKQVIYINQKKAELNKVIQEKKKEKYLNDQFSKVLDRMSPISRMKTKTELKQSKEPQQSIQAYLQGIMDNSDDSDNGSVEWDRQLKDVSYKSIDQLARDDLLTKSNKQDITDQLQQILMQDASKVRDSKEKKKNAKVRKVIFDVQLGKKTNEQVRQEMITDKLESILI